MNNPLLAPAAVLILWSLIVLALMAVRAMLFVLSTAALWVRAIRAVRITLF